MTQDQLRQALGELKGNRDAVFFFVSSDPCTIPNAMLIPDEPDHMIKLTDGKHVYILDAEQVAWIKIG